MTEGRPVSVQLLKSLAPLEGMKRDNLEALARKVQLRQLPAGRMFFKQGEKDQRTIWVVAGTVELREGERTIGMIRGGAPESRNPLAPGQPRRFSARAIEDVDYIAIDSDLLDVMITWDQTGTYEVAELQGNSESGGEDWMTTLLSTKAFHRIPPANIQAIFPAHAAHRLPSRRSSHQAGR